MSNKLQCPQCGASNSRKISETEYHCGYCDSNFTIGKKAGEFIMGDPFKKSREFKSTIAQQAEVIGKKNRRTAVLVFILIGLIIAAIFVSYKMHKGT